MKCKNGTLEVKVAICVMTAISCASWTLKELKYYDPPALEDRRNWKLAASHNAGKLAAAIDHDPGSRWDTGAHQRPGMWFSIELPEAGDFGGAFGAARLGMMAATGGGAEVATPPRIARTITPQSALVDAFTEAHVRYKAGYHAIRGLR